MSLWISITILYCTAITFLLSQECPGPISYDSADFTIRGPCPNDTVLVLAVGSTIQYRCDYIDERHGTDLPYWYIPELSGTPFLAGEGHSEHGITVYSDPGAEGHTTLTIPVKEQYLNNTLNIQCGLCSGVVCYSTDRLSENIISTAAIKMITHGSPRHLNISSVFNGIVMFQWSRPLASDDNFVFIYTVQLMTNTSSVSILSFITTNTNITLSRLNITGNDRCIEYTSWSVSVENSYTMTNGTNGGNIFVIFLREPSFSSNITTKLSSSCSSTIRLELSFTVSSIQPLHTLDYDIWLNDTIHISYHSKHNTSITFTQHQLVSIEIPLVSISHDEDQLMYITVTISNECGEDTVEDLPVNGNSVAYCKNATSTLLSHDISSTLLSHDFSSTFLSHDFSSTAASMISVDSSIRIPLQTVTFTSENLSIIMATILPTERPTEISFSTYKIDVIIGCICAVVLAFIIILSMGCIVLYTRHSTIRFKNRNSKNIVSSPSTTMNQVYGIKINNNPLSSIEQTQEEPEQKINVCYDSVNCQVHHDDDGGVGSGAGGLNPQYEEINTIHV